MPLRGPYVPTCLRSSFLVLSHAPAWATNMSPNLVYFKAHPRGFEVGAINWSLGDLRKGFLKREGMEKRRLEYKA